MGKPRPGTFNFNENGILIDFDYNQKSSCTRVDVRAGKPQRGSMKKFQVALLTHEEGVSVSCPELPGCHSQGKTVDDALENIRDAIEGYLELYGQPEVHCEFREMEVLTC